MSVGHVLRGRRTSSKINFEKQTRAEEKEKILNEDIENEKYYSDYTKYKRANALKVIFSMAGLVTIFMNYQLYNKHQ